MKLITFQNNQNPRLRPVDTSGSSFVRITNETCFTSSLARNFLIMLISLKRKIFWLSSFAITHFLMNLLHVKRSVISNLIRECRQSIVCRYIGKINNTLIINLLSSTAMLCSALEQRSVSFSHVK